jgi:FixJ family two-component response regulator
MTVKAMKSGAEEFLTKAFQDQDLLGAIQQALANDASRGGVEAEGLLCEPGMKC